MKPGIAGGRIWSVRRPPYLPETRTCAGRSIAQLTALRRFTSANGAPGSVLSAHHVVDDRRLDPELRLVDAVLVAERGGSGSGGNRVEVGLAGLDLQEALVLVPADRDHDAVGVVRTLPRVVLVALEHDRAADVMGRDVVRAGSDPLPREVLLAVRRWRGRRR